MLKFLDNTRLADQLRPSALWNDIFGGVLRGLFDIYSLKNFYWLNVFWNNK